MMTMQSIQPNFGKLVKLETIFQYWMYTWMKKNRLLLNIFKDYHIVAVI